MGCQTRHLDPPQPFLRVQEDVQPRTEGNHSPAAQLSMQQQVHGALGLGC